MAKRNIYTALIGILSAIFAALAYTSDLNMFIKAPLAICGIAAFMSSAVNLYMQIREAAMKTPKITSHSGALRISRLDLLNEKGRETASWELYNKVSLVIGKDIGGASQVDVDLSRSPFAATVDVEHAVMNYSAGDWYIEDIGSRNGISLEKIDGKKYKLSPTQPCKLEYGDIICIGLCKLKIN